MFNDENTPSRVGKLWVCHRSASTGTGHETSPTGQRDTTGLTHGQHTTWWYVTKWVIKADSVACYLSELIKREHWRRRWIGCVRRLMDNASNTGQKVLGAILASDVMCWRMLSLGGWTDGWWHLVGGRRHDISRRTVFVISWRATGQIRRDGVDENFDLCMYIISLNICECSKTDLL